MSEHYNCPNQECENTGGNDKEVDTSNCELCGAVMVGEYSTETDEIEDAWWEDDECPDEDDCEEANDVMRGILNG